MCKNMSDAEWMELRERLAVLESKLDLLSEQVGDKVVDHETRLRHVEDVMVNQAQLHTLVETGNQTARSHDRLESQVSTLEQKVDEHQRWHQRWNYGIAFLVLGIVIDLLFRLSEVVQLLP